jgi:hypothetical protein
VLRDITDLMIIPKPEKMTQPFATIKLITLEDKLLREIFVWVQNTPATDLTLAALAGAIIHKKIKYFCPLFSSQAKKY